MKTHTNEFENEVEAMQHRTRPVKPVLGGFLVGSLIGVATALLFAPRSGEETRAEIRDRAVDLRDRTTDTVRDSVSQARSRAYELKDTVVEKAEGLKDRGKQTLSRKLDDASQAIDNGKQKVQES
jgi:gas vesicle protein